MTSFIKADNIVIAASVGLGIGAVVVGSIAYLIPKKLPSQESVESTTAEVLLAPVNIAAKMGVNIGDSIMRSAGYKFTPDELERRRTYLFSVANVPYTDANAAQRFHELMVVSGQQEQLKLLRVELLSSNDAEWNQSVQDAYFPMYYSTLVDDIDSYLKVK